MQRTAGLTALKIGIGQMPVLDFHRISLVPIIAAENIAITAVGIHRSIRTEIDQRRILFARMHPRSISVGDGLQILIIDRSGVPFEVVSE